MIIDKNIKNSIKMFKDLNSGDVFFCKTLDDCTNPLMVLSTAVRDLSGHELNAVYLDDGYLEYVPEEFIVIPIKVKLTNEGED